MKPPKKTEVNESPNSFWWTDENGFLCIVSKPEIGEDDPTQQAERLKKFQESLNGKKICILIDARKARFDKQDKKYRNRIAKAFNQIVSAMAIIATTPMNKMMVNLFFDMQKPTYPFRIFEDEQSAKKWLKDTCSR